jgi:hypothetical protein
MTYDRFSAPSPSRATVKGVALREFLRWYVERESPERLREIYARLPLHARDTFDPDRELFGVLVASWYSEADVHALFDAVTEGLSSQAIARLAEESTETIMSRVLTGLYGRLFSIMATPKRYARYSPRLWGSFFRTGEFEVELREDGHAVCDISNWTAHHRIMCDINFTAARCIFEAMGCENVSVSRTQCVSRGDPRCRFVMRWKPGTGG